MIVCFVSGKNRAKWITLFSDYCYKVKRNKEVAPGCWKVVDTCVGSCGGSYHQGYFRGQSVSYPYSGKCCKPIALMSPKYFYCDGNDFLNDSHLALILLRYFLFACEFYFFSFGQSVTSRCMNTLSTLNLMHNGH